jgi:hypothetical protein
MSKCSGCLKMRGVLINVFSKLTLRPKIHITVNKLCKGSIFTTHEGYILQCSMCKLSTGPSKDKDTLVIKDCPRSRDEHTGRT